MQTLKHNVHSLLLLERVWNGATLSDTNLCDDGRGAELPKQLPGCLSEAWAALWVPDLHNFRELRDADANPAGEPDGKHTQ